MDASQATSRERRLSIAIGLNLVIVAAQVVAGLLARSLGLLADAAHNLTDVLAIGVALVAVRLTRRPTDVRRSFGWHRSTVLAALFNAVLILAIAVVVVVEAVPRLEHPAEVRSGAVIVVALVGLLGNGLAARAVSDGSHDINMRGAFLHLVADAATSLAVAVVGVVMLLAHGWYWLDPAVAIMISALIAWPGLKLARNASDILLESTPQRLDPHAVVEAVRRVDGVEAIHDLHTWSLSSELTALSAHLVVSGHPSLEEAQSTAGRVKAMLAADFGIGHSTLEVECEACEPEPICEVEPTR